MIVYEKEKYQNSYYIGTEFEIQALEYPNFEFGYFNINGTKYYDKTIIVSSEMLENNKIKIELVFNLTDSSILISEISAKNDNDWIKLTNASEEDISISNYCISDDKKNYIKYELPNKILKSGESIIINGNKNYYSIGDYIGSFNLSIGETIYLYDKTKNKVVDKLKIPKMTSNETYGRAGNNSCIYMYFNNKNGQRKNNL
ncbi:MAG: lamin tail domain-containing protein [Clostridia bacterium]|nr:lamin tail domain-containing protein [Clostridia bacterium]